MQLPLSLCSWSLESSDADALRAAVETYGIHGVHYQVDHLVDMELTDRASAVAAVQRSGLPITATMVHRFAGEDYSSLQAYRATGSLIPDEPYPQRRQRVIDAARVSRDLGVSVLTFHVGFLPTTNHRDRFNQLVDRFGELADQLAAMDAVIGFETGQETADTLHAYLQAVGRPNIGVNFDPANMILYGMGDPVASIERLAPYLKHLHAKDARKLPSPQPGAWHGEEVVVGTGDARVADVIRHAWNSGYRGAVAIEREVGPTRHEDIVAGIAHLKKLFDEAPIDQCLAAR